MHTIETYWYVWAGLAVLFTVIAFARQLNKIRNIDKFSGPDDFMSGMGLTFAFAGGAWIFGIVTIISIALNIITYVKA